MILRIALLPNTFPFKPVSAWMKRGRLPVSVAQDNSTAWHLTYCTQERLDLQAIEWRCAAWRTHASSSGSPRRGLGHIPEAHEGLRAIKDRKVLIAADHKVMQRRGNGRNAQGQEFLEPAPVTASTARSFL